MNYDEENWNAIKKTLKTDVDEIHVLNRAQIVDDLFALAEAKHLDYDFVYDILEYLPGETAYQPWKSAFAGFKRLAQREPTNIADFQLLFKVRESAFLLKLHGSF